MKEFLNKIRASELLTLNDLLRVKVSVVMVFLLIFGLLTIPVSFFEDFALSIRIIVPVTFVSLFTFTFIMLMVEKSRIAMHFSIYTFLGLTVYYVDGSGQIYGYFLLFITLTVIIFYQDITTYILYGGVLTIYGVFFIQTNESLVTGLPEEFAYISPIIYQVILIGFFIAYLLQFILTDSINENLNDEYVKTFKANKIYQQYVEKYIKDLEDRNSERPLHKKFHFQEFTKTIASELYKELNYDDSKNIDELVEYYFFLHQKDISEILDNKKASSKAKHYAYQFKDFFLRPDSHLINMYHSIHLANKPGLNINLNRYSQSIDKLFSNKTNRILSIAVIYLILHNQITQVDKWGRLSKVLEHDEIKAFFQSKAYREIISFEDVNFFISNEETFKKYL